jgi:hypothetical protein
MGSIWRGRELAVSTRCCHLAKDLIAAIPDAMIGRLCGVNREGERRLAMCSVRLTGDLWQVFWTRSGLSYLLYLPIYPPV